MQAGHLSAIVVIVNGSESRMMASLQNVLSRLANNLPNAFIEENLLLLLTKTNEAKATFSVDKFANDIALPKVRSINYLRSTSSTIGID